MLKSVLSCDRDLKEAAMIEQRRSREEERKRRFFDEKQRVLGIDSDWLNKQLHEKNRKKEEEDEQERLAAEEMRKNLEIAEARENEMQEQKKKAEIELNEFRMKHQQKKDSNDFDLFDADGLKKSLPGRVDDNDARLSVSGGQLFIGEDLTSQKRIREQQQLQKLWLDQQIAEQKALKADKKMADNKIGDSIAKHDTYTVFLGNRLNEDKREIQRQIREYNQMMAQQKLENDKKRKELEQNDNLAEIYNFLSSDLLQENQPKGSSFGTQRCIPYMYKGMNPEQIAQHKLEQEKQLQEMQQRRIDEQNKIKQWENFNQEQHRQMCLQERSISKSIRQMNHQIRKENENLAVEQKFNAEQIKKVLDTNTPNEEYFDKFNTTSR